ncbi:zincin [Pholiota conissans]|uniref:Zincin n=1 Tax=Pholiota conissans TaxID=109636 RepID=A0A9P6D1W7_9AGAR|nr:zincin [Pholiota conissans]
MISIIKAGCIGLWFLTDLAWASSEKPLSLKTTGSRIIEKAEDYVIRTIITNESDKKLHILNDPRGPLLKLPTDTFRITDANGAQPRFKGVRVKYLPMAKSPSDYRVLDPGESVETEHDLNEAYDFSDLQPGPYEIMGKEPFYAFDKDTQTILPIRAHSISHHTHIKPLREKNQTRTRTAPFPKRAATFIDCTDDQQETIRTAAQVAQDYALNATSYANSVTEDAPPRYTTWFGRYTTTRYTRVAAQFSAISSRDFSSFTYDCSCDIENTFAYVYPHEFGHIYLCGAFWKAPMSGTDSKAGHLSFYLFIYSHDRFVGRNSHNAGGTIDHTYGHRACKALALTSPNTAVINADSHEYFAENHPELS